MEGITRSSTSGTAGFVPQIIGFSFISGNHVQFKNAIYKGMVEISEK